MTTLRPLFGEKMESGAERTYAEDLTQLTV